MPRYRFTEHITPTLKGLGGGAISFSLGRPFGCVERFDFPQSEQWSQMTPEILITPSPDDSRIWEATIETPTLATPDDMELFGHGLGVYAAYAAASIPPK